MFVLVAHTPAELARRLTQRPSELGHLLATEHQQHDSENDEQLRHAHRLHDFEYGALRTWMDSRVAGRRCSDSRVPHGSTPPRPSGDKRAPSGTSGAEVAVALEPR